MAHVPRWAILRKNRVQNLAEHSFFVAVYAQQVASMIGYSRQSVTTYALYHDIEETLSGDIPGPYKRHAINKDGAQGVMHTTLVKKFGYDVCSVLSHTSQEVKDIVSVADAIDELCYLIDEMRSGNVWVSAVIPGVEKRLEARWMKLPAAQNVLDATWKEILETLVQEQMSPAVLLGDPQ